MMKWLTLCTAAMFALLFAACDDNNKDATDIDNAGDTDAVTDTQTDTQTDGATDEDALVTDDTFVIGECTKIDIIDFMLSANAYEGAPSVALGNETLADQFSLQFYIDATTVQTELTVGTIDLATAPNNNYATCTECALLFEDYDTTAGTIGKYYFQYDGTLDITEVKAGTMESKGTIAARLVEVTIETGTYASTPVIGGACYEITGSWDTICVPSCAENAVCGSDGCGGECGEGCAEGRQCNADHTACIDCTPITIADITPNASYEGVYGGVVDEELGVEFDDIFRLEFYGTQTIGDVDLSGMNYIDCPQCVVVIQDSSDDAAANPKVFFQQAGTLTIDAFTATTEGGVGAASKGSLTDVRLVEVSLGSDYTSTPVAGGACLIIADAEWDTMGGTPTDDDTLLPDN